ncbi:MAG TPA: ATP synthase F1 subunit delta [Vicinamibacteria bacterium]|jgi:F-type H+-transporting ATPase subunit delta
MTRPGAARRYARALLELAVGAGDPAAVRQRLREAAEVAMQPDLLLVIDHPTLPAVRKRAVLAAVLGAGQDDLVLRLVLLLAQSRRLSLLPDVERSYETLWNARQGVVTAEVVTAQPLEAAQEKALARALRGAAGREVELRPAVRPEIIGGVLVRMEDRLIDGSVRGKLAALRETLRP